MHFSLCLKCVSSEREFNCLRKKRNKEIGFLGLV